jgi:hypothetical protein
MSAHVEDNEEPAIDLTGIPLDKIASLCRETAAEITPEDARDLPVLRRALCRAKNTAGRAGEAFAGHGEVPPPLPPLTGQ